MKRLHLPRLLLLFAAAVAARQRILRRGLLILGAVLLLGSDLIARTLLPPQELPVGVVTSSIGALFVVTILLRQR